MEITPHAAQRIRQRVRMHPLEVLSLLEDGACLSLGMHAAPGRPKGEFLLFYSLKDESAKIALVSPDHSVVRTVWESHFILPEPIRTPSKEMVRDAKALALRFLLQQQQPERLTDRPYTATLAVLLRGKVVYIEDLPELPRRQVNGKVASFLGPFFIPLKSAATETERVIGSEPIHVRYCVRIEDPDTQYAIRVWRGDLEDLRALLQDLAPP